MNNTQKATLIGAEALSMIEWYASGEVLTPPNIDIPMLKRMITRNITAVYSEAQLVKCVNGVTFFLPLRGDEYALIKAKVSEAKEFGGAYIMFTAVDGQKFYTDNIPYLLLFEFIGRVNSVSMGNHRKRESNLRKIEQLVSVEGIDSLDLEDFTFDTVINLNDLTTAIKSDIDKGVIPESEYTRKFIQWYDAVHDNGEYLIFQLI
jgi:hypothetical protein